MEHVSSSTAELAKSEDLLGSIRQISDEVARPAAAEVDREARFPHEAIAALRNERLLAAFIPVEFGGLGLNIAELATMTMLLAQSCSATGMIWAMHHIQIGCLVRHGLTTPFFRTYLTEVVEQQHLIASATSEVGVGGDIRTSITAVEHHAGRCRLAKQASTVSYGAYADGLLATARRAPNAAGSDQVLVLLQRATTTLEQTTKWNMLGMRGTCSPGFRVEAEFGPEQILPMPFADIAAQTMVPFSHILWSACWLGIATDAMARARRFLRGKARQNATTPTQGQIRLAQTGGLLQLMRTNLQDVLREYAGLLEDEAGGAAAAENIAFAIKLNNLKILSSELVVQIVSQALAICGMAGYSLDSPYSVGRHLRDAYSAGMMVGNDRLYETNSVLQLVSKDQWDQFTT